MNYQETMEFLEEIKQYGSILGLGSIKRLLHELGNPERKLPVIHVAGTNGKGSTSAFLGAIYQAAGYHVCRFATPDVFCYEEEFLYDNVPIGQEDLSRVFTVVREACERIAAAGYPHPTRFEVETAAAFLWFSQLKPDICIVEVGMGGDTDATNVLNRPLVSVLTAISRDHMGFLGNTLAEIALVKAGIIKYGCPVVSTWQEPQVEVVIRQRAEACKAELSFSAPDRLTVSSDSSETQEASFDYRVRKGLISALKGTYQYQNAALALDVVDALKEQLPVPEDALRRGLSSVKWPGRFEVISTEPTVYIDGAHNPAAARELRRTMDQLFPEGQRVYLMGVLADKEYEEIADIMFRERDVVYCVTPDNPRALAAGELVQILKELSIKAYECAAVGQALETAMEFADLTEGVVVAFGSLSYLKEVKQAYHKIKEYNV